MNPESASRLEKVLLNGSPGQLANGSAGRISPYDRGVHFGDGLFETIACRRGRPRFLSLHLERLRLGCQRLAIEAGPDDLASEIRSLASEVDRSIVKLVLTRGAAVARGYAVTGREKATRITFRYPWPQETRTGSQDGVHVRTAMLRLGENPALAGLKHCNRLEQVLARREWTDPGIAEALLFSSSGKLVSGTMSNVFIVDRSGLRTPRVDLCGVAGVMRRVVLREATRVGIPATEDVLDANDLHRADEIFLTNARLGIWPVRVLDDRALGPNPTTRQLQEALEPLLENPPEP